MGSQQFFLLLLTLLLVSLVIFSGFQFVNENLINSDREVLIEEIDFLYDSASKYRNSLAELDGKSVSYVGWEMPNQKIGDNKIEVNFVAYSDRIIFFAKSKEIGWDEKNQIKAWVRYSDKNGKTVRFLN